MLILWILGGLRVFEVNEFNPGGEETWSTQDGPVARNV